jgi:protein-tyrosine phosphatase
MTTSNSTSEPRARRLAFDALFNFRDLGGYPVRDGEATTRWGVLFRSDGLHRATTSDLERLAGLGLASVVDLRTPFERIEDGSFDDVPNGVLYHHVPLFEDLGGERPGTESDDYLLHLYIHIVTTRGDRVAEALRLVIAADRPLAFHCTAGKDRTGVIAALVLSAVGVPDDVIADDYALSGEAMDALVAWYRERRRDDEPAPMQTAAAMNRLGADAEWMRQLMTFIRAEYGSIEGYLRSIGLGSADLVALSTKLVD